MLTAVSDCPVIAFGPELPGIGSWEWVGADIMRELAKYFDTTSFQDDQIPKCDAVVIVKYKPPNDVIVRAAQQSAVLFCPIDFYGSSGQLDLDGPILCHCARVLIHCQSLRKYFQSYTQVEFIDHHLRFVPESNAEYREEGEVLWVGMRTHLPILSEWLRRHPLPAPLRILTNLQDNEAIRPEQLDLLSNGAAVAIEPWSHRRHVELTAAARCALDIKGYDFRQRYKPPAKAIDFIASGLPLAMNPGSSSARHLAALGFDLASPDDWDRWVSRDYFEETRRLSATLRNSLSLEQIGLRFERVISAVLDERKSP